eukprot:2291183-Amphidinium_carterae.1
MYVRRYAVWSGWDAPGSDRQFIYIAPMLDIIMNEQLVRLLVAQRIFKQMVSLLHVQAQWLDMPVLFEQDEQDPLTLAGRRVCLCSNCSYPWELTEECGLLPHLTLCHPTTGSAFLVIFGCLPLLQDGAGSRGLNEGPQVLQHGGRTFIVYSCGASWCSPCLKARTESIAQVGGLCQIPHGSLSLPVTFRAFGVSHNPCRSKLSDKLSAMDGSMWNQVRLSTYKLGMLELLGANPLDPRCWRQAGTCVASNLHPHVACAKDMMRLPIQSCAASYDFQHHTRDCIASALLMQWFARKHPSPVFASAGGTIGVGHSCFVASPDLRVSSEKQHL